jgi:NADH-quinone oxidoreductase subunit N
LMFIMVYDNNLAFMLKICAILSMCVGSVGAVMQTSFKRLIGYSTILNMGYVLVPISSDIMTWHIGLLYFIIYAATTIGIFAILPIIFGARSEDVSMSDLDGLSRTKKVAAVVISIFMFSMIGLPPFAGFFGKYMVIYTAFMKQEYMLVFFMVVSSVIAAYYYLRVIKAMYFGEVSQSNVCRVNRSYDLITVVTIILIFILFFSFGIAA